MRAIWPMNHRTLFLAALLGTRATLLSASVAGDSVYLGAERQLEVRTPRVETASVRVDGELSEPEWANAAVLTGFTQLSPAEGAPASEHTEARVFYTPSSLYIGVRALTKDPARIRATLADRDKIQRDDQIQILLDTFNDRRRAYAFHVNPLGIQQDGIYNEGSGRRRGEQADYSPDFIYESRGRLTPEGYVVEIRIPLKSLKFAAGADRQWGINIIRQIAATGAEESWAPISRSDPSRLAQSGTLTGIGGLRPGTLLEVNPVVTGRREGTLEDAGFVRGPLEPDLGVNVKYGVTSNLTLDATYNPDFSQVEADAGQITTNERFALFFPEKRPFFLEGADLFSTPEQLVYTRSIVNPVAGAKLTGKVGSANIGYLGAVDESPLSPSNRWYAPDPSRATFHIARVARDVGSGSTVGALLTDREAEGQYNRVVGVDGRLRFGRVYTWQVQAAQSWTRRWRRAGDGAFSAVVDNDTVAVESVQEAGHLLHAALDRSGRDWGFRFQAKDIPSAFRAQSGFIRRTGVTDFFGVMRLTRYGQPGALVESWGPFVMANRIYGGRDFWRGERAEEGEMRLRLNANLRGNNRITAGYANHFFDLDASRYGGYRYTDASGVSRTGEDAVAPQARMTGLHGLSVEASSSYLKWLSAETQLGWTQTPIFAEGTAGAQYSGSLELQLRPTDALRAELSLRHERLFRRSDGSLYSSATLPRLRAEYQLTRAIFVRAVAQYAMEDVDVLRAPDGTPYQFGGVPVRVRGGNRRDAALLQTNPLRTDLLFSYQPSPGTVIFLGYGREMEDDGAYRFSALDPRADGLFFKLSYLFRN